MGTARFDVCGIAQTLLRPDPNSRQVPEQLVQVTLTDLDETVSRLQQHY
jgi:hypothetical protein